MPQAPAELRSLRGRIQGAPPIRMGGPTEQYKRSRGQQKSFGLGQIYGQPQPNLRDALPWEPGPLQLDPIRRVTETRDPTIDEEREEEGRRLRQRLEIGAEFDAPERAEEARKTRRKEFLEEQRIADVEFEKGEKRRKEEEVTYKKQLSRRSLHRQLVAEFSRGGMSQQEAGAKAWDLVEAGQAKDYLEDAQSRRAAHIKAQPELRAERQTREAARGLLPEDIRPAIGPGGFSPSGGRVFAEGRAKAALETEEAQASTANREKANQAAQLEYLDFEGASTQTKRGLIERAKQAVALEDDLGAKVFLQLVGERYPSYVKD